MEIQRHWRLKAQRYRLVGSPCKTCGQLIFPPRPVCSHCTAHPAQIAKAPTMTLDIWLEKERLSAQQVFSAAT